MCRYPTDSAFCTDRTHCDGGDLYIPNPRTGIETGGVVRRGRVDVGVRGVGDGEDMVGVSGEGWCCGWRGVDGGRSIGSRWNPYSIATVAITIALCVHIEVIRLVRPDLNAFRSLKRDPTLKHRIRDTRMITVGCLRWDREKLNVRPARDRWHSGACVETCGAPINQPVWWEPDRFRDTKWTPCLPHRRSGHENPTSLTDLIQL
jgi:hypothetical protein